MFVRYSHNPGERPAHTVSVFVSADLAEGFARVVNEGHDSIGRAMLRKLAEDAQAEPTDPRRAMTVIPSETAGDGQGIAPDPDRDPFRLTVYCLDDAARAAETSIKETRARDGETAVVETVGAFLAEHGVHAQYLGSMVVEPFQGA